MADHALAIEVRAHCSEIILLLTGELDLASAATLSSCLASIDGGVRRVVLDLSELTFIDSSGIALIAQTQLQFESEMRDFALHNPRGPVARVLELTGMTQQISITR